MSEERPAIFLLCLALAAAILAGCSSKVTLISFGAEKRDFEQWVNYSPPRGAEQPLETSVLEAARDHFSISEGGYDILYVASDAGTQVVAVVEQLQEGADLLAQRQVVRYRVADGKIAGKSSAALEVFPDVQFERAVILTARKAGSLNPVTLYEGDQLSVSMASRVLNRCAAVVKIYDREFSSSTPLAEKVVNFCH